MDTFNIKKPQREDCLGFQLLQHRNIKDIKLEDVSRRLGIKIDYLKAIESDRFDLLPPGIYGRNFLKKYAKYLKFEGEALNAQIKQLEQEDKSDPFAKKAINKKSLRMFPKMIKNAILISAIAICFLYLAFYARKIAAPPKLSVNQPNDNLIIREKTIRVEGVTEEEAELKINGELVLNNNNGLFFQDINLKSGLNSITISAKKKHSKESIITRQILVE